MRSTTAFILAGGQGNRLYPLTLRQAKPAVSFGASLCLLDLTLLNCCRSGLRTVHVLAQHHLGSILERLRTGWGPLEEAGIITTFLRPPRDAGRAYRGTADAVWQNMDLVPDSEAADVLILSGDHVYDMDYRNFLSFHREAGADLTIGATPVSLDEAQRFGILDVGAGGKVIDFREKPERPTALRSSVVPAAGDAPLVRASMGVYAFRAPVLRDLLVRGPGSGPWVDFGNNLIPSLIDEGRAFAYDFLDDRGRAEYWRDVGTVGAYFEAQMDLVAGRPSFRPRLPSPVPRSRLTDHVWIEGARSLVATRSAVRGEIYGSVVAPGAVVERGARVVRSILLEGAVVERGAFADGAVIGQRARLRSGVVVRGIADETRCFPVGRVYRTPQGVAIVPLEEVVAPEAASRSLFTPALPSVRG